MNTPVSIQLYTLREETAKDFPGTLEQVARIGYQGVEFAGYSDIPVSKMKEYLKDFELKASGTHVDVELLEGNLEWELDYSLEIGSKFIICPWADPKTKDDFLKLAEFLNGVGEKCKKAGITLCYHNHAHEFVKFDEELGLDLLYKECNPEFVQAEIDTYWVQYAGIDPSEYIRKYKNRCPLIHFKDMDPGKERTFTEVGNGIMDFAAIAEASIQSGSKWFIVEQDQCRRNPIESITISYASLKRMNLV